MKNNSTLLVPSLGQTQPLIEYCNQLMASENTALGAISILEMQPSFEGKLFPTLPNYQENLVRLCHEIKSLSGATLANSYLSGLQLIADEVVQLLGTLREPAMVLDQEPDSVVSADFTAVLDDFSESLLNFDPNSSSPLIKLEKDTTLFKDSLDNIKTEVTYIKSTLASLDNQEVLEANLTKISSLKQDLDDLNTEIAKGATTKVFDCVALGLATGACFVGPELEAGMIVGAVVGIIGEGGNVSDYIDEQQESFDTQEKLVATLIEAVLKAEKMAVEYGMLGIANASALSLDKNLSSQLATAQDILDILKYWKIDIDALSNKIGLNNPEGYFVSQVTSGIDYWTKVRNVCNKNLDILANCRFLQ
ncbi:MAG: hypothetical protein R2822_11325 [Spirosomataceae bacterium]